MIRSKSEDVVPGGSKSGIRPFHYVAVGIGVIAAAALGLWIFDAVVGILLWLLRVVVVAAVVLAVTWVIVRVLRKS
ncbi:MAG: hypothetical protein M0020_08475 [Actinomycetota bacterium]|nr:hypothetical protein [Actinomycetota bacterium]